MAVGSAVGGLVGVGGLVEGDDVFGWGVWLDGVGGADDVGAVGTEDTHYALGLRADLVGGGVGEEFLFVDAAMKSQAVAEAGFEVFGVHAGGFGLDGVEDVQSHLNEVFDHWDDAAAGVIEGGEAHVLKGTDEAGAVRFDVAAPQIRREHHAALGADVAAATADVDAAIALLQGAEGTGLVEVGDVLADGFGDVGTLDQVHQESFHAAHVPGGFEGAADE